MGCSSSPPAACVAAAILLAASLLACHHGCAAAAAVPTLSTASRWVVDESGSRVKLACVNWPSHLEPMLAEGLGKRPVGAIAGDVAAMGFNCVRFTWPTFLVTNASYSGLTVAQSFLRLNLTESLAGIRVNNPGFVDLKLIDAFKAVVSSLGEHDVMVILDNHLSKPGWCCSNTDGNGFFGDALFDPDVWVDGLTKMATMFAGVPNVVGMSLRNELRGPRQNANDWYKYMQRGAEAVHAANPRVLVILSGLQFDNDLAFLNSRPVNLSFTGKVAFEVHWYSFSNTQEWSSGNANQACARITAGIARRAFYLLDRGWPVILSEFGVDNRGGNTNDNRYYGCAAAAAADLDLDWALWALQGSYYLREGVLGLDEVYGVLDWAWCKPRNDTALRRVQALQRPLRGPGLAEAAPYAVLFHPVSGMCVVVRRRSPTPTLAQPFELGLGPCSETGAWEYSAQQQRLGLRDTAALLCLRAEGAGRPATLGVTCGDAMARWSLVSDSKLHVAVNATSSSSAGVSDSDGNGLLCLDVGADGRSVVTNPCRCLSADNSCDPQSQWFKLVSSTRSVVTKQTMLAQLPLKLKSWKIRSF
ncbi:uncharacterized protein LOC8073594 [Sorghum bicolor]|uniref:Glycoside hydrolase family 5 domain-containing protein n=1 Tax=Sorghum bicolor TaxID=4558 RepID=C5YAS7_SORBI|nr:uncharacterized protein LOC8073594 [Sorghum bicolor]EES11003.1 hypothetical protein SORBI_3006G122300 [Sorghum bicolor]|eukprot:XP_002446675.1 uncharacterized protein LOC8073594 [Sorghum bicolor]